jgi:hypothetical protein
MNLNFTDVLNQLMGQSDKDVMAYLAELDKKLPLTDNFFRNFLIFMLEQREKLKEFNKEASERVDEIINISMLFTGSRLNANEISVITGIEPGLAFNAEDENAKKIASLENRSFEAINLKNEALATGDSELMSKAESIHLENIKLWEEMNLKNSEYLIKDLYQLALIYKHQDRFEEAEALLKRVVGYFAAMKNTEEVFQHKIELGKLYFKARNPGMAWQVLEECREYFENKDEMDEYALFFIYKDLAMLKYVFNENGIEQKVAEGLTYLVKASFLEPADRNSNSVRAITSNFDLYKEYSNYYEVLGKVLEKEEKTEDQLSMRLNNYNLLN